MKKQTTKTNNKEKILEETVNDIKQKFGEGSIMKLGEVRKVDVDVIHTGSPSLDMALGVGGMPRGRIIEVYGAESSGKTTLALHMVAEAQKNGGMAAFVDAEHALDPEYARRIGVKIDDLLISQPDSGEQALQIVESLVKSGTVDIIIIDSVAALTPQAEIEGEIGDQFIGLQARLMSQAMRKLNSVIAKTNCVVIFINQIRMKIGMMFGNPETTPGGKALKFYASVRIELKRTAQIKKGEEAIGNRVKVKVVKNKVAPPFQSAEFDIMFNEGISYEGDLVNAGLKYGVIKKSASTLIYENEKLGVGTEKAKEFLRQNKPITKKLLSDIQKAAKPEY
ncbi:MAG TPA: recombinase RecA [Candidatus Portnoybacteria bacterium]|jgi:recombination protein RecA|nr:recombinase RecA [Candidatus Portnoybacteria bacterium]MDD5752277.1 recombinase RecA [Candidatus Portnoybacteria bacterium]HNU96879.1 recombinase RecA [Candidatus Portnoybacteria bacterium]HOZ16345.1 recombinase RecA [Candidatus Portnoybacteria bacterium]HPH52224.1 recombinase RecA [Candidatus Portnoybacteria bacterium]